MWFRVGAVGMPGGEWSHDLKRCDIINTEHRGLGGLPSLAHSMLVISLDAGEVMCPDPVEREQWTPQFGTPPASSVFSQPL